MVTQSGAVEFGKRIAADFSEKNVSFMAAAIAYHAFVSLAPLLLLLLLVLSTVGVGAEHQLIRSAISWLPGPIAEVVTDLLRGGANGASAIGLLVLLWGTLKIFRGLDTAFAEIYGTGETLSLVDKVRDGVVVLAALALALVAMVGSSVVLGAFNGVIPFSEWFTPVALLAGLVVAFYPIYYVFPDTDVGYRDVLPGVLVAALGWGALQGLFQLYLSVTNPSTEDFFGGVIVVVTYLYFSALVLLLGAVVNAARRDETGEATVPDPAGVDATADQFATERTASLDRPELGAYLADLRAELVGDRDATDRTGPVERRPAPDGTVELVEQSATGGDENEWLVTLRWRFTDEELVDRFVSRTSAGSRSDDASVTRESSDD